MDFQEVITDRVSVVAPCLNEEDNVAELYGRLLRVCESWKLDFELILVDDGSTDETWSRSLELVRRDPSRVVAIRHDSNRGIPGAWKTGIESARGEYVCLIDSDLQNPPESIVEFYKSLQSSESDIVKGVRVPVSGEQMWRVVMSKSLNLLLNLSFGMRSRDNKSGFLLGRTETIATIIQHSGSYKHYQTFIGVSAHCHGYLVTEIATPFERRHSGESFLAGRSLQTILGVLADIREARREFRPLKKSVKS